MCGSNSQLLATCQRKVGEWKETCRYLCKKYAFPLFILSLVKLGIFYVLDVYSDIYLAVRYLLEGDTWWGAMTSVFVGMPWILHLIAAAVYGVLVCTTGGRDKICGGLIFFAGLLNMAPIAILISAAMVSEFQRQDFKRIFIVFRLIELVFESFPQGALQMYIAAQSNHFDFPLIFTIATSTLSVVNGINQGVFEHGSRKYPLFHERGFLLTCLFLPWILLHFLCLIPPLAFLASLKHHSSPSLLILAIYFPIHCFVSSLFSFVYPLNGGKKSDFLFLNPIFRRGFRREIRPVFQILSALLQFLFTFACIWISTCWIVSLAPFFSASSVESIPAFIWPNPAPGLRKWIIDIKHDNTSYPWAICNLTTFHEQHTNQSIMINATTSSSVQGVVDTVLSFEFCLTDVAVPFYLFFVFGSILLLVYHLCLLIFWPLMYEWFFMTEKQQYRSLLKRIDRILNEEKDVEMEEMKNRCVELRNEDEGPFDVDFYLYRFRNIVGRSVYIQDLGTILTFLKKQRAVFISSERNIHDRENMVIGRNVIVKTLSKTIDGGKP